MRARGSTVRGEQLPAHASTRPPYARRRARTLYGNAELAGSRGDDGDATSRRCRSPVCLEAAFQFPIVALRQERTGARHAVGAVTVDLLARRRPAVERSRVTSFTATWRWQDLDSLDHADDDRAHAALEAA
jgi:hypothetical protein